jgi:hypothetical protein
MPKKENLPQRGIVRVTFELPSDVQGNIIHLVGDFTGWEGTPMEKQPDGSWRTTVDLAPAGTYEFRYLIDGTRWENDWQADDYVANAFGQENSVVTTPELTGAGGTQRSAVETAAQTPAKKGTKATANRTAVKKTAKAPAKKTAPRKTAKTPAKRSTAATSPAKKSTAKKAEPKTAAKKTTAVTSPAKKSAAKEGGADEQLGPSSAGGRATSSGGQVRDDRMRMAAGPRPTATDGAPDA